MKRKRQGKVRQLAQDHPAGKWWIQDSKWEKTQGISNTWGLVPCDSSVWEAVECLPPPHRRGRSIFQRYGPSSLGISRFQDPVHGSGCKCVRLCQRREENNLSEWNTLIFKVKQEIKCLRVPGESAQPDNSPIERNACGGRKHPRLQAATLFKETTFLSLSLFSTSHQSQKMAPLASDFSSAMFHHQPYYSGISLGNSLRQLLPSWPHWPSLCHLSGTAASTYGAFVPIRVTAGCAIGLTFRKMKLFLSRLLGLSFYEMSMKTTLHFGLLLYLQPGSTLLQACPSHWIISCPGLFLKLIYYHSKLDVKLLSTHVCITQKCRSVWWLIIRVNLSRP